MDKHLRANYFFLILLVIIISVPTFQSFGQIQTDVGDGVFFVNTHPYSYKDENGFTVVLGEIFNKHSFPISDVKILVNFYGDISEEPIDSVIGNTILDTIPAQGNSPFLLKSPMPNSSISKVGATLLGFDSAPAKQTSLSLETDSLEIGKSLNFSGQITNNGNNDATNIKIHLISNDIFVPPRVVNITSITLDEPLSSGDTQKFSINGILNSKAFAHYVIAESDETLSQVEVIDENKIISRNKIISINDVAAINIKQDDSIISSPIRIEAQILMQEFTSLQFQESYTFYVQIKDAESGLVEFISSSSAILYENSPENPSIIWLPDKDGLFFIETYLWDKNDVVLASPGEILLVHVSTE